MNDPHVVWLLYGIEHGASVDYRDADPFDYEGDAFRLRVENKQVRFEMKDHRATERAARAAVESFIATWEFDAQLAGGRDTFRLRFLDSLIEDRAPDPPPPGVVSLRMSARAGEPTARMNLTVCRAYPAPPSSKLCIPPYVRIMHSRFLDHQQGKEPIASVAYFCYTVLLASAGNQATDSATSPENSVSAPMCSRRSGALLQRRGDHKHERRKAFRTN